MGRVPFLRILRLLLWRYVLCNPLGRTRHAEQPMERICGHAGMDTAVPTPRTYVRDPSKAGRMGQNASSLVFGQHENLQSPGVFRWGFLFGKTPLIVTQHYT